MEFFNTITITDYKGVETPTTYHALAMKNEFKETPEDEENTKTLAVVGSYRSKGYYDWNPGCYIKPATEFIFDGIGLTDDHIFAEIKKIDGWKESTK
jgi:hypothetical protein